MALIRGHRNLLALVGGGCLIVAGVGMVFLPAAVILAGVGLIALGIDIPSPEPKR